MAGIFFVSIVAFTWGLETLINAPLHANGSDPVLLIVSKLPLAAVASSVEGGLNGFGNHVRIKNDASFLMPSGAACCLN